MLVAPPCDKHHIRWMYVPWTASHMVRGRREQADSQCDHDHIESVLLPSEVPHTVLEGC
jgi:hypothetical protein